MEALWSEHAFAGVSPGAADRALLGCSHWRPCRGGGACCSIRRRDGARARWRARCAGPHSLSVRASKPISDRLPLPGGKLAARPRSRCQPASGLPARRRPHVTDTCLSPPSRGRTREAAGQSRERACKEAVWLGGLWIAAGTMMLSRPRGSSADGSVARCSTAEAFGHRNWDDPSRRYLSKHAHAHTHAHAHAHAYASLTACRSRDGAQGAHVGKLIRPAIAHLCSHLMHPTTR